MPSARFREPVLRAAEVPRLVARPRERHLGRERVEAEVRDPQHGAASRRERVVEVRRAVERDRRRPRRAVRGAQDLQVVLAATGGRVEREAGGVEARRSTRRARARRCGPPAPDRTAAGAPWPLRGDGTRRAIGAPATRARGARAAATPRRTRGPRASATAGRARRACAVVSSSGDAGARERSARAVLSIACRAPVHDPPSMTRPSDTTFVLTSCGRFDLLAETMLTFLACNTAPIARYLIVEDSGNAGVRDVLGGLGDRDRHPGQRSRRSGQMASIDRAYAKVDTPYVFHCEDDWRFLRGGFVEESRVVLDARDDVSVVVVPPRPASTQGNDYVFERSVRRPRRRRRRSASRRSTSFPEWGSYTFNPGLRRLADCPPRGVVRGARARGRRERVVQGAAAWPSPSSSRPPARRPARCATSRRRRRADGDGRTASRSSCLMR